MNIVSMTTLDGQKIELVKDDLPPLPAVEHYSDQWADGYRAAFADVLTYLRTDGKAQIVQWAEGMFSALASSKP